LIERIGRIKKIEPLLPLEQIGSNALQAKTGRAVAPQSHPVLRRCRAEAAVEDYEKQPVECSRDQRGAVRYRAYPVCLAEEAKEAQLFDRTVNAATR
jgi:hypothetical protein